MKGRGMDEGKEVLVNVIYEAKQVKYNSKCKKPFMLEIQLNLPLFVNTFHDSC